MNLSRTDRFRHILALSLATSWLVAPTPANAERRVVKRSGIKSEQAAQMGTVLAGQDPHAYKTAAAMCAGLDLLLPSDDGLTTGLVRLIDEQLARRPALETQEIGSLMVALNPYRGSPQVQQAVDRWSSLCARPLKDAPSEAPVFDFEQANRSYREGDFVSACRQYADLLGRFPGHKDTRNNLSLALLRSGNDLLAQIELEILHREDDTYLPAIINLTVVYERHGWTDRGRKMAGLAFQAHQKPLSAVFNYAWYLNLDGERVRAANILGPLASRGISAKCADLYEMNKIHRPAKR